MCNSMFTNSWSHTKTCGDKCRKEYRLYMSGRTGNNSLLPSGTVGCISEILISVDMMNRGYSVFRALSPACFCDLIAVKDGHSLRIECRTAYKNKTGNLCFSKEKHGEIDIFALYVPKNNEFIYLENDAKTIRDII